MQYLIKATYTPNDQNFDRSRKSYVIENETGVLDALTVAISKMEIDEPSHIIQEYLKNIGDSDTSEGWSWTANTNDGTWHFEWSPFDPIDPVTKEAILDFALHKIGIIWQSQPLDHNTNLKHFLVNILGRMYWRAIENWDSFDLKQKLHEIAVNGADSKPYNKMTVDELLDIIITDVVGYAEACYDPIETGRPFGMTTMIANDTSLWLDE